MEKNNSYQDCTHIAAIKLFSTENRLLKLSEEIAEMMVELTHANKKFNTANGLVLLDKQTAVKIAEEIEDVKILLDQIKKKFLYLLSFNEIDQIREDKRKKFISVIADQRILNNDKK